MLLLKDKRDCRALSTKLGVAKKRKNKQSVEKESRKEKILGLMDSKKKIKNNDVQKLLKVSDASATRYLEELEKEGKIEQVGKTSDAYYKKK